MCLRTTQVLEVPRRMGHQGNIENQRTKCNQDKKKRRENIGKMMRGNAMRRVPGISFVA
jgi:hypothetical protein